MPLPLATPRQAGVDAQGVLDLLDAADHLDLHSLAIARGGRAFARGWWAPYAPDLRHLLYSISKSVTATTIAALVTEGRLDLDDPVLDHVPPSALIGVEVADIWRRVTLRHCLTMTVGQTEDAWSRQIAQAEEPIQALLATRPLAEPGTVFAYNQVATYLASRAAEHRGGAPLDVLARERVLAPLGSTDMVWETDRGGHPWGFSGVRMRTDDLLALTQLWLDGGAAAGQQVVPAAWVAEASAPFLSLDVDEPSDWTRGYGQSFWTSRYGYRADGAFGQLGLVLPEQQLAVAVTSEVEDMGELLELVWHHLAPAVGREGAADVDQQLADRLASLTIPPLRTTAGPPEQRSFPVDPASDVTDVRAVRVDAEGSTLTLVREHEEVEIEVGHAAWRTTTVTVAGRSLPLSASGGWTEGGYAAEIRLVETPHSFRLETSPAGASLRWRMRPLTGGELTIGVTP